MGKLGFDRSQSKCHQPVKVRVQNTVSVSAGEVGGPGPLSNLPAQLRTISGSERSCKGNATQKSDRDCRTRVTGFLQSSLCSSQKEWKVEAHNRSKPTEQVHKQDKVQDGDTQNGAVIHKAKPMVYFDRFDRRLLPHTNSSLQQTVSAVCVRGEGVPISSTVLRNITGSSNIHGGDEDGRLSRSPKVNSPTSIYRRLAVRDRHGRRGEGEYPVAAGNGKVTGLKGQPGEIRTDSYPENRFSGNPDRHCQAEGLSISTEVEQLLTKARTLSDQFRKDHVGMVVSPRTYGFSRETSVPCSHENASNSVPSETVLVRSDTEEPKGSSVSRMQTRSVMVGRPEKDVRGDIIGNDETGLLSVFGCVDGRLGCDSRPSTGARSLDTVGGESPHKRPRTGGSCQRSKRIPDVSGKRKCLHIVRQYDCCISPEQTGGDKVTDSLLQDGRPLPLVGASEHQFDVKVCSGSSKCQGRHAQPKTTDTEERMGYAPRDSSPSVEEMGQTYGRPVRYISKPQTASILLADSRSGCIGSRRNVTELVRPSSVCVPSHSLDTSGSEQGSEGSGGSNSDSAQVAKSGMVSGPPPAAGGKSGGTACMGKVVKATPHAAVSQKATGASLTRLETVIQSLQTKGFSKQAADLIAGSHRAGTSSLYQAKWNVYLDWCGGRQIDPLDASICTIADFFIFLFEEKKFSVSTIKGYRSALAQVYHYRGVDLSNNVDISSLMKTMEIKRPVIRSQIPKWDLTLVLRSLTRAPYEPMRVSDLKFLTRKTAFLLLLATAKRVSEVHALTYLIDHTKSWSTMTLHFDPSFVAKTQKPSDQSTGMTSVTVPALAPSVEEGLPDRSLCPVRAVRYYLDRTAASRPGRRRLFIPVQTGREKDISKNTLSHWVQQIIREAYSEATDEDARLSLRRASVHELRAMSTSLLFHKNQSLSDVMAAACWKGSSTFASFYLRDVSLTSEDLSSLGPIVAAQEIINQK